MLGSMAATFVLGFACTLAEPAMGALELAGENVNVKDSPYLWLTLNLFNNYLVIAIGTGVGFAALVGTVRLLVHWKLAPLVYFFTSCTIALTWVAIEAGVGEIVGLAW
jgi:hypothetical protein